MRALLAVLIIVILFSVNVWLYRANKNTPVPEGCEDRRPDCGACGIRDCAMRRQFTGGEKEENHGNH